MRRIAVVFSILLMVSFSAAELDSKIAGDCGPEYEPVISLSAPHETYSNPAAPGFYDQEICVSGVNDVYISSSCDQNTGFYLSSNTSQAHFSIYSGYNLDVCTGNMVTRLQESCFSNQTALFSVSGEQDAHVAAPGFYEQDVCGFYAPPENVSLTLTGNLSSSDTVRFDGEKVGENRFFLAELPYFSSSDGTYLTGIIAPEFISAERKIDGVNTLTIKREKSSASFIIPFTEADYHDIEDWQKEIISGSFMNRVSPAFGFVSHEETLVKVVLDPEVDIDSSIQMDRGSYTLELEKTGENNVSLEEK